MKKILVVLLMQLLVLGAVAQAPIKRVPNPPPQKTQTSNSGKSKTQTSNSGKSKTQTSNSGKSKTQTSNSGKSKTQISISCESETQTSTTSEASGYDVSFSCNVSSATMYIDGRSSGSPSGSMYLRTGSHQIKVTAEGYEDYTGSFTVSSSSRRVSIDLRRKQAEASFSGGVLRVGSVTYSFVRVRAGSFTMGATSEQENPWDDEKPAHRVTLTSDYWMGATEVTQALWKAVMGSNPSMFQGDDLPVESVSWDDCQDFLEKLNRITGKRFRLPTEAEWEYAARGGGSSRGYQYAGGSNVGNVAWYYGNAGGETHPVGQLRANELGLYDMSGNVWEWCQDWYGKDYYSSGSQTNPTGPSSGSHRVLRGGTWYSDAWISRSSIRNCVTPDFRNSRFGFRLVLSE
ncbi:MAG: formylglycine-generating enzyme family protein [Bacteroidales bacterium]|nr:formylglycine-generating enzyme family protein [Bacteroidales bacterium]